MARKDPLRNFRFRVEIDGLAVAAFSEVVVGATTIDVIEYREGSEFHRVRKLPGLHKFGDVTLKRGITTSLDLANWYRDVLQSGQARRSVAIVVMDEAGADQARFVVNEAWPTRYEVGALNGKGNEVLIESLTLANEGIEREA